MRSSSFLIPLISLLMSATTAATFEPVQLTKPLNWVAGSKLFPSQIIAGYNAPVADYDATSWGEHILGACAGYAACTSALIFQGTNSGSTGGRFWFGYVFRGGSTDESFYERDTESASGVTDSAAWTIVE